MKKQIIFLLALFAVFWTSTVAEAAIIVGRIGHVEGDIYRYMDVGDEWVETFVDSPAGTGDILATGAGSRTELIFPNNHEVRLAENTEIEIIGLAEGKGEFYLANGLARFYNNSTTASLQIKTDRGIASIPAGSAADLYAQEGSLQIWTVHGSATFLRKEDGSSKETLEVIDQSTSLMIYPDSVTASNGLINRSWHNWCRERENVWQKRQLVRSQYMPEPLQVYTYSLKPYGRWRRVNYRGYYYWAWQPHHVAVGWAPYTTGYWHDWHGDRVWIDHNPWGWVTHHHGHWMHVRGSWLWSPYVHVAPTPGVTVTSFAIVFGSRYRPQWHPGRVRWIAHNDYVGWLPLAPWEIYYGRRRWGPRSVARHGGPGINISFNINLMDHHHLDHAVVIPRHHFKRRGTTAVKNYRKVMIKNINRKILVKNYKPLPVVADWQHRKRERAANRRANSVTQVFYKGRKIDDRKKFVDRGKERHERKLNAPVPTKVHPRKKAEVVHFEKRKKAPARIIKNRKESNGKRIALSRKVVQGERLSFIDVKEKRKTVEQNAKYIKTRYKKQKVSGMQYRTNRQQKTAEQYSKNKLGKEQKHRVKDKAYVEQQRQRKNERYSFSRRQENGKRGKQKVVRHRERYSMNRS